MAALATLTALTALLTLCTARPQARDLGPQGRDPGPQGRDPGPQGRDPGPQGRDPGPQGREPGPQGRDRQLELPGAMMYLMKYGYMGGMSAGSGRSAALLSPGGLRGYIMDFQAFGGLAQTGELDDETLELMRTPRCGVKDVIGSASGGRRKRFALQGSRWKVKALTYKISKYPARLAEPEVDKEIQKALNVWAEVTDLTFEQRTFGKVHIDIKFEDRTHGDGDPFDGKGGTLAHAFFPVYGGDAHFDDSEAWTVNSVRGTNLLQTAAHEFGHSLGLSHSDQHGALMAPFYRGFESRVRLEADDVRAIQALYGKGHKQNKKAPVSLKTTHRPLSSSRVGRGGEMADLCSNTSIDSMLTQGEATFTFKGGQYWRLTDDSIAPGYPRPIAGAWDGLPDSIDTSFTWTNGKTYFFKGDQYWRHSGTSMDKGYPKLIEKGFDGIPNNLDAAFVWSGNGKIYFFKGTQYWKFDPDSRPPVRSSYPRPISNWEGVPNHVNAAVQYTNGFTYFFKAGLYYRFDDTSFRVSDGDPAFPRPLGFWWFGCQAAPLVRTGG